MNFEFHVALCALHFPSATSCMFYIYDQNKCSLGNIFHTGGSMSGNSNLNVMVNLSKRNYDRDAAPRAAQNCSMKVCSKCFISSPDKAGNWNFCTNLFCHTEIIIAYYRLVPKKGTVLLSTSMTWPAVAGCSRAETFSQLSSLSFAQPCTSSVLLVVVILLKSFSCSCNH